MKKLKVWMNLIITAGKEFGNDNAAKLAASLAYYTIFAIGPLILVVLSITGLFFEQEMVTLKLQSQLRTLLGTDGAKAVLEIITNLKNEGTAAKYSIIGVAILIFTASGVFIEIQSSINFIWALKAKPKRGWLKFIKDRVLSISLIGGLGFLLIVSLLVNTVTDAITGRLMSQFGDINVILFQLINLVILFALITVIFAIVYKVLPDGNVVWKDGLVGGAFTSVLFMIGKFLIGYYLGNSSIANTYGAAASFIILLSWVYYSSLILYFGAEFTKVYSLNMGKGIHPGPTAVFIVKNEAKEIDNPYIEHPEQKKADVDVSDLKEDSED